MSVTLSINWMSQSDTNIVMCFPFPLRFPITEMPLLWQSPQLQLRGKWFKTESIFWFYKIFSYRKNTTRTHTVCHLLCPSFLHLRAQSYAERLRLGLAVIHGEAQCSESDMADGRHSPPCVRNTTGHTGLELPCKNTHLCKVLQLFQCFSVSAFLCRSLGHCLIDFCFYRFQFTVSHV